jgi:hypothetical protein
LKWLGQINGWVTSHNNSLSAWASLITVISLPLLFIGLFVGYHQIRQILVLPEPSLEFVHPSSVAYKIVNKSEKIAEDVLVSFGIFDLDLPKKGPLPVPSVNYDYVNRNSEKGPFSLFANFATPGHRYFGIVYIGCKEGKRLRTYWIYVKHSHPEEGFCVERNEKDTYEVNPGRLATDADYFEMIVPENRRRMIK